MKPTKISMEGFLSYKEKATIDLRNVSIACISGANGSGKTSLVEAITWSLFGKARERDDELINSQSAACWVALEFVYEDICYAVKRSKKAGQSAILTFSVSDNNGHWTDLTEKTVRLTDAKIQSVIRLNYDTFVNAAFFLQGQADLFTRQTPAERKRILSDILDLSRWEKYQETAASELRERSIHSQLMGQHIADMEQICEKRQMVTQKMDEMRKNLDQVSCTKKSLQTALLAAKQHNAAAKAVLSQIAQLSAEADLAEDFLNTVRNQVDRSESIIRNCEEFLNSLAVQAPGESVESVQKKIRKMQLDRVESMKAENEIRLLNKEKEMRKLADNANVSRELTIEALQAQIDVIITEKALSQQKIDSLEKSSDNSEVQQMISANRTKLEYLQSENSVLKERMNQLNTRLGIVSNNSICPTCESELSPTRRTELYEEIQKGGSSLGNQYRENLKRIAELGQGITSLSEESERRSQAGANALVLRAQLEKADIQIERYQADIAKLTVEMQDDHGRAMEEIENDLRMQEERISSYGFSQKDLDDLLVLESECLKSEKLLRDKREKEIVQESEKRHLEQLRLQLGAAKQAYAQALSRLNDAKEASDGSRLQDTAVLAENVSEMERQENKIRHEIGQLDSELSVISSAETDLHESRKASQELSENISDLEDLIKAYSRNGVPAYLIEAAIPEIEAEANQILGTLSNGRMSVFFQTLREYKEKSRTDMKETLDISVLDSSGCVRQYESFSGGEAFRLNFAIRIALSKLLASRAEAQMKTLVIDEGFGSQDAEGKQRLLDAIQVVRNDFDLILVITHMEDLKSEFPCRIEVSKDALTSKAEVIY